MATALDVRRVTVGGWESGRTEPRPPEREAYARLLKQLAQLYPTPERTGAPQEDTDTVAARTVTSASPAARPQPPGGSSRDLHTGMCLVERCEGIEQRDKGAADDHSDGEVPPEQIGHLPHRLADCSAAAYEEDAVMAYLPGDQTVGREAIRVQIGRVKPPTIAP